MKAKRPELTVWPPEVTALAQRIERLQAEAQSTVCGAARAELLRQAAAALTARLEVAKAAQMAREAAA